MFDRMDLKARCYKRYKNIDFRKSIVLHRMEEEKSDKTHIFDLFPVEM